MLHLLAALAAAAVAATADDVAFAEWLRSLDKKGWEAIDANVETVAFAKRAPSPSASYRRVWIRFEYRYPDPAAENARSSVALFEVDCPQERDRALDGTTYTEQNLGGKAARLGPPSSEWSYAIPGTLEASIVRYACKPGD